MNINRYILLIFNFFLVWVACHLKQPDQRGIKPGNEPDTANTSMSDSCQCPLQILYHRETRNQNDSGTVVVTLPKAALRLDLLGKKMLDGSASAGAYRKTQDRSHNENLYVEPGSQYEIGNRQCNLLCTHWIGMCRRGFRDKDWDDWKQLTTRILIGNELDKDESDTPVDFSTKKTNRRTEGLNILEHNDTGLRFTCGYSGNDRAWVQVRLKYMDHGRWYSLQRNDLVYALPSERAIEINLTRLGFSRPPEQFDFEIRLLTENGEVSVMRAFELSLSEQ